MPTSNAIAVNHRAKASGYKAGCIFNGFVHKFIPTMGAVPDVPYREAKDRLVAYYNEKRGTRLDWAGVTAELQTLESHNAREAILGPFFKARAKEIFPSIDENGELGDEHACAVLREYGWETQSFCTHEVYIEAAIKEYKHRPAADLSPAALAKVKADTEAVLANPATPLHPDTNQLSRLRNEDRQLAGPRVGVYKTLNVGNHWIFEIDNAAECAAHNLEHDQGFHYNYERHEYMLGRKLRQVDPLHLPARKPLNQAIQEFEMQQTLRDREQAIRDIKNKSKDKSTAKENFNFLDILSGKGKKLPGMAGIFQNVLGSLFGDDKASGGIFGIIKVIFGGLFSFIFGLQDLFGDKKAEAAEKKPEKGAALTDEEIMESGLTEEASTFDNFVTTLANKDRQAGFYAKELNDEWRKNPNSREVWMKLIKRLEQCNFYQEAFSCLNYRDNVLREQLEKVEDPIAEIPGQDLHNNIQRTRARLQFMRNGRFYHYFQRDNAIAQEDLTEREMHDTLAHRIALHRDLSLVMQDYEKMLSDIQKLQESAKERADITAEPTPLSPSLAQRLDRTVQHYQAAALADSQRCLADYAPAFNVLGQMEEMYKTHREALAARQEAARQAQAAQAAAAHQAAAQHAAAQAAAQLPAHHLGAHYLAGAQPGAPHPLAAQLAAQYGAPQPGDVQAVALQQQHQALGGPGASG